VTAVFCTCHDTRAKIIRKVTKLATAHSYADLGRPGEYAQEVAMGVAAPEMDENGGADLVFAQCR